MQARGYKDFRVDTHPANAVMQAGLSVRDLENAVWFSMKEIVLFINSFREGDE